METVEKKLGEIGVLIVGKLHEHQQHGNRVQEFHYLNLLFDYWDRMRQGLVDGQPYNLPPLESTADRLLAERYRNIIGILEDGVDVYDANDHFHTHRLEFSIVERSLIPLAFNRAIAAVRRMKVVAQPISLGDIRRLTPADIAASRQIRFRRALIFLHGIQSKDRSDS